MPEIQIDAAPEIGTAAAAVQTCVNLIAGMAGQPEKYVAYWLDLYYQVRSLYEKEHQAEPDPNVITRADLYPVLRELMQDALKSTAPAEPGKDGKAEETGAAQSAPPSESGLAGFEAVTPAPKKPGAWTLYKRKVMDKLHEAREAGTSIAAVAKASEGVLTEHRVMDAIDARHLSRAEWYALEKALDQLAETADAGG